MTVVEMPFRFFHRHVSSPVLSSLGLQSCPADVTHNTQLDVFVGSRIFRECGGPVGRRLSIEFKEFARLCGACHYMVVFKSNDGSMVEFDFGPAGGDIHIAGTNPFALQCPKENAQTKSKGVPGEIREQMVTL